MTRPENWIFTAARFADTQKHIPSLLLQCSQCGLRTKSVSTADYGDANITPVYNMLTAYWNAGLKSTKRLTTKLHTCWCGGNAEYVTEKFLGIESVKVCHGRYGDYHAHDWFRHFIRCVNCGTSTFHNVFDAQNCYRIPFVCYAWNKPTISKPKTGGVSWLEHA